MPTDKQTRDALRYLALQLLKHLPPGWTLKDPQTHDPDRGITLVNNDRELSILSDWSTKDKWHIYINSALPTSGYALPAKPSINVSRTKTPDRIWADIQNRMWKAACTYWEAAAAKYANEQRYEAGQRAAVARLMAAGRGSPDRRNAANEASGPGWSTRYSVSPDSCSLTLDSMPIADAEIILATLQTLRDQAKQSQPGR